MWVVYVVEQNRPQNVEPIEWMPLTSEAVEDFEPACVRVDWYVRRWIIEMRMPRPDAETYG
ncbi:MAG: hypothetical protein HY718_04000 [Planctomycetes bacterium]|nr:hypothetical protein [Planctomycetota bacterium]